jgi:hypothetical protein
LGSIFETPLTRLLIVFEPFCGRFFKTDSFILLLNEDPIDFLRDYSFLGEGCPFDFLKVFEFNYPFFLVAIGDFCVEELGVADLSLSGYLLSYVWFYFIIFFPVERGTPSFLASLSNDFEALFPSKLSFILLCTISF